MRRGTMISPSGTNALPAAPQNGLSSRPESAGRSPGCDPNRGADSLTALEKVAHEALVYPRRVTGHRHGVRHLPAGALLDQVGTDRRSVSFDAGFRREGTLPRAERSDGADRV